MLGLGIETSCDETAASLVEDGRRIVSNVVSSQIELHKSYQGVFPELASRRHLDTMLPVIERALDGRGPQEIDYIAVTSGPGLIGALVMGIQSAKALSLAWDIPIVGVNHIEAHLYASMMEVDQVQSPSLGIVVSGGHTAMYLIKAPREYELISTTVDDAIGEAFDKVASLLDLPYPGGPAIEQLAKKGDASRFKFRAGRVKNKPLHFSFSGLKTNVLYAIKGQGGKRTDLNKINDSEKKDIAASFQLAAISDIVYKGVEAAKQYNCGSLFLGGGVSSNALLRELFVVHAPPTLSVHFPKKELCLDNAAMIAGLGFHVYRDEGGHSLDFPPNVNRLNCLA